MTFNIISTGSKGNAVVINNHIMVDCGVPYSKLREVRKDLKIVLLTHRHGDHFNKKTVARLHQDRPTLRFACCDWMVPLLLDAGVDKRVIDVAGNGSKLPMLCYKNIASVMAEPLVHDVPNCGWHIHADKSCFYATDTGTLSHVTAKGYDYYLIEANHTEDDIKQRIYNKKKSGEYCYESRAAENHLSQEQAESWLAENMGAASEFIFLHQHEERSSHGNKCTESEVAQG